MKTVRIGIVGLGIGKWHLESFAETPGAEVIALCDLDAGLLRKLGAEHGIARLHEDYRDLVADPEVQAVSVCVPNSLHAPVALAALREQVRPEWAEWTEPDGGYLIWLRVRSPSERAADLDARLAAHGVRVAPGRHFFCDKTEGEYLRLSISTLDEDEIRSGIARLAVALQEVCHASV